MPPAGRDTSGRSSRDKLLAQGLRLFAERGFDAVSVGEIEQAAGLVPRRGAMYRHFASKDALLEAVVPYSSEALERFLGGKPEQFCSARTARGYRASSSRDAASST